ncbi:MAG: Na+/H+ antiporter NhaC family protein [Myxococcota bacterium]|nr:Na+/H+ antiporter NhaC family protein [Myxococcota bacterium]
MKKWMVQVGAVIGAALLVVAICHLLPLNEDAALRRVASGLFRAAESDVFHEAQIIGSRECLGEGKAVAVCNEKLRGEKPSSLSKTLGDAAIVQYEFVRKERSLVLTVRSNSGPIFEKSQPIPTWFSFLPPLLALGLAIATRNIILSLFLGGFVGVVGWGSRSLDASVGYYASEVFYPVISSEFNLQILGFTFALVGMVGLMSRMGATAALVDKLSRFAIGPRSGQVVTASMGGAVFFDDYANTVVVGSTARSLTDRLKISREKLAYIVDSTSAPVAGLAIISTWIGYEVGLFESLLGEMESVAGLPSSGYGLFFAAIPLRFYCWFALATVFLSGLLGRDFGPMLKAERRARQGQVHPDPDFQNKNTQVMGQGSYWDAVLPVLSIIGWLLYQVGKFGESDLGYGLDFWRIAFSGASDATAGFLLESSLVGSALTFILAMRHKNLSLIEAVKSYATGAGNLLGAGLVLILAWVLKDVCDSVGTGMGIVSLVGETLPPIVLPATVFVLAGGVAFCTGTSWGTMAIVLPVAVPLAVSLTGEAMYVIICLGAVLDGAIFGDHCSPISDTTVLSSTATDCPLLDHVKTQLPYAFTAMVAAVAAGYVGYAANWPLGACYAVGLVIILVVLSVFGEDPSMPGAH